MTKTGPTFRRGRRAKPQAAGDLLQSLLGAYHLDKRLEKYAAFPRWEEVVGPEVAEVAVPERISRNCVLVVRVIDPSWAQELTMRKVELLEKINSLGTGSHFEDLKFLTGGPESLKRTRRKAGAK